MLFIAKVIPPLSGSRRYLFTHSDKMSCVGVWVGEWVGVWVAVCLSVSLFSYLPLSLCLPASPPARQPADITTFLP